jgi:hypothetical protein
MSVHVLTFDASGEGHCLYTELLDLASIGGLEIVRASQIEFNNDGQEWEVIGGSENNVLFSHASRSACLAWEQQYFNR